MTKAQRINRSLTAAWEKKNLPKMAKALPAWVTPDHLTILAMVGTFAVAAGYVLSSWSPYWFLLALVGLPIQWYGDSLDGTLARVRKTERERYGYHVDHTADAVSTVIICVALGLSPYVSFSVALLLATAYLLLQISTEIRAYTSKNFPLSFGGFGPTEARIALGIFTLVLMLWRPEQIIAFGVTCTVLDLVLVGVATMLFSFFVISAIKEARRLDLLDRA